MHFYLLTFSRNHGTIVSESEGSTVTKEKKVKEEKEIIKQWQLAIISRGYFIRCEDFERLVLKIYYQTGCSKTKIKRCFWKHIYEDKEFLNEYEC